MLVLSMNVRVIKNNELSILIIVYLLGVKLVISFLV